MSEPIFSVTGAELDPVDMRPVFADGMSRRRWLDANREERMGAFIDQLTAPEDEMVQFIEIVEANHAVEVASEA